MASPRCSRVGYCNDVRTGPGGRKLHRYVQTSCGGGRFRGLSRERLGQVYLTEMVPKTPGTRHLTTIGSPSAHHQSRRLPCRVHSRRKRDKKRIMAEEVDGELDVEELDEELELEDDLELDDELGDEDGLEVDDEVDDELADELDETPDDEIVLVAKITDDVEDLEQLTDDDVEASLDEILKEKMVVEDEPEDDDVVEDPDRNDPGRVLPKQPDEFVCSSCFLVKHPSQLADKKKKLCRDCI